MDDKPLPLPKLNIPEKKFTDKLPVENSHCFNPSARGEFDPYLFDNIKKVIESDTPDANVLTPIDVDMLNSLFLPSPKAETAETESKTAETNEKKRKIIDIYMEGDAKDAKVVYDSKNMKKICTTQSISVKSVLFLIHEAYYTRAQYDNQCENHRQIMASIEKIANSIPILLKENLVVEASFYNNMYNNEMYKLKCSEVYLSELYKKYFETHNKALSQIKLIKDDDERVKYLKMLPTSTTSTDGKKKRKSKSKRKKKSIKRKKSIKQKKSIKRK